MHIVVCSCIWDAHCSMFLYMGCTLYYALVYGMHIVVCSCIWDAHCSMFLYIGCTLLLNMYYKCSLHVMVSYVLPNNNKQAIGQTVQIY